jgi:RNA polymerase sigma-70 factor (ECF subfamily)
VKHGDPFRDPAPLIRRVYSYVAYRLGEGTEAEDVTSEVFERALRYRASYDETRGEPLPWLLGIARHCVDDAWRTHRAVLPLEAEQVAPLSSGADLDGDVVRRVSLAEAIERLDERARDLLALRYGADLTAKQIGRILGLTPNAVDVALHRTLARLRADLAASDAPAPRPSRNPAPGTPS